MLSELRDARPPDAENARRRAWSVTSEAFAERPPRRSAPRRLALAGALTAFAALLAGLALTPPGDAVADFVRRVVDPPPQRSERPASPPGAGEVLVTGKRGLRIVGKDGAGRSLGRWDGATWSPQARFIGAWRGPELAALGRDGTRRWRLRHGAPVTAARWSPEGFHVAYMLDSPAIPRATIRVVAGNGLRDRLWRRDVAPVAPAFRPTARRTLAWVRADGRVPVADVFTGAVRALSGPRLGAGATEIAWTGDGRRLAVLAGHEVRLWTPARGTVSTFVLDDRGESLAAAPGGTRLAALSHDDRRGISTVTLLRGNRTLRVRGRLRDLTFAPDGRTLLAAWPTRRRWLVVGAERATLDATLTTRGATGHIAGWCC